jgi:Proteasome subunit
VLYNLSDAAHRQLLSEYISLSIRAVDECAQIFLGTSSNDDTASASKQRRTFNGYPRFLTFEQFEEVFGLLLADPEPHFNFFCSDHSSSPDSKPRTVCAHQVFGGIVLFLRTDPHTKISFFLRLYADAQSEIPPDQRRQLLKDMLVICKHVVTGTSVIALKYKGGVLMAADTLGSYGSLARFTDQRRLASMHNTTLIGAGGD